jgi:hypothetical protein
MADEQQPQHMQIQVTDDVAKGRYANNMTITAVSPEEFMLDFMLLHPLSGQIVGRVIVSPGHLKRMMQSIEQTLTAYEQQVGKLEAAQEPRSEIGFKTS